MMDTARFKYPPHWVDIEMLYKSICTTDSDSGELRGFILLTRKANHKDRATLPPTLLRQPVLPSLNIHGAYVEFGAQTQSQPSLRGLLNFMGSDDRVKTLLFAYLFQVNDWFGVNDQSAWLKTNLTEAEGYLSKCNIYKN